MNTTSLYYFCELSKDLNITTTAKRIFVSQQALSQHIQKLEETYGTKLFYRKPHLSLTYAGEQLLYSARRILDEEKLLNERISDIAGNGIGALKLGISTYRAHICLPNILPVFHDRWPNITMELFESSSLEMEKMTINGQLDIFVGVHQIENPKLITETLIWDDVYLVVSDSVLKKYYGDSADELKEKAKHGANVADFAKLPFLLVNKSKRFRKVADECFLEAGIKPTMYMESLSTNLLITLYPCNIGAFFISRMALPILHSISKDANVFPLLLHNNVIKHQVIVAYHKERHLAPFAYDFVRLLTDYYTYHCL